MEIVDLPHLPPKLHPQLADLGVLNGDAPQDIAFIRRLEHLKGFRTAPYYGVYAVDAGEILAKVEAVHPRFTFPPGAATTMLGLVDVFTRPDSLRRGLARQLLEEVHRREQRLGRPWSFLWTHASWGAHRLYEQLGYRDVYRPWTAVRRVPPRSDSAATRPYRLRAARRSDLPLVERLRHRAGRGRIGFTPAFPHLIPTVVGLGWRQPGDFRILERRRTAAGYALVLEKPTHVLASDIVVSAAMHADAMIDELEALASDRWLALDLTTFVRDHAPRLRERGYRLSLTSHRTLMAMRLGEGGPEDVREVCGASNFMCVGLDRF